MAYRTSERDVKLIMNTTLTETELAPYLHTASLIVDTYLTGEQMAAGLLREIEAYLTAHFAEYTRDRPAIEEIIGDAEIKYPRGSLGMGLDATSFGQTAKQLDSSGILAGIGTTTTAALEAIDLW